MENNKSAMKSAALKYLLKLAARFDGERFYSLSEDDKAVVAQRLRLTPLIVVDRKLYREEHQRLPLMPDAELRKLINLRQRSDARWLLSHSDETHHYLVGFHLLVGIPQGFFWLPESALLAKALPAGQAFRIDATPCWYLATNAGFGQSIEEKGIIDSPTRFLAATGSPAMSVQALTATPDLLVKGLSTFGWANLLRLRNVSSFKLPDLKYKAMGIMASVFLVAYLAMGSAYQQLVTSSRENQQAALGKDVDNLLRLDQKLRKNAKAQAELVAQLSVPVRSKAFWDVLGNAQLQGARLTSAQMHGEQVKIQGIVDSSTALYSAMEKLPMVAKLAFDAPTRKVREGENFSLSITLRQPHD